MEMKKQGGEHSIDDNVLKEYVAKYVDFLNEEINVLRANIFVCTSPVIFDFSLKRGETAERVLLLGRRILECVTISKEKPFFLPLTIHQHVKVMQISTRGL